MGPLALHSSTNRARPNGEKYAHRLEERASRRVAHREDVAFATLAKLRRGYMAERMQ